MTARITRLHPDPNHFGPVATVAVEGVSTGDGSTSSTSGVVSLGHFQINVNSLKLITGMDETAELVVGQTFEFEMRVIPGV